MQRSKLSCRWESVPLRVFKWSGMFSDIYLIITLTKTMPFICISESKVLTNHKWITEVAILLPVQSQVKVTKLSELHSSQEETDTRIIIYIHHAVSKGYKSAVVRTPDTDLFFILLHHAQSVRLTIIIDIWTGKHRQLVNITELSETLEPEFCSTLLGYYVYSGEDCTSSFKGKGKIHALKDLEINPKYHTAFR